MSIVNDLERMSSSQPSLSYSNSTTTTFEHNLQQFDSLDIKPISSSPVPTTPVRMARPTELPPTIDHDEPRKAFGKLNLSRSMHNLKSLTGEKNRERSKSSVKQSIPTTQPTPPLPAPTATKSIPTRPAPARSGSSFSSFIRRLTGKSDPPKPVSPARHAPPPSKHVSPPRRAPPPIQIPQLQRPMLPNIVTKPPPARVIDPVMIPLPPSPDLSADNRPEFVTSPIAESVENPIAHLVNPASIPLPATPLEPHPASPTISDPSLKRVKQTGLLSLPGFAFEEEEEEQADVIQPLRPNSTSPTLSVSMTVNSSVSGNDFALITPTSINEKESLSRYDLVLGGSSPPRKAPIGKGPVKLEREKTKWRKSVLNISDNLTPGLSRKISSKPPPSSYDAYQAQQRRMAANRVSCAPTLHSTASVAAEMREVRDKEQESVMETFFLS